MDWVLAQCPCSGGQDGDGGLSGISTWAILAVFAGMWLLARFIWKQKGASLMGRIGKIAILLVLAAAVIVVVVAKNGGPSAPAASPATLAAGSLPRLVDLGSTTCIPCKMMAPVLEQLRKDYAGRMRVDFINVNENPDAAKPFDIKLIPTQVFFDAAGKELWRHEGFIAKEDILAKWNALGVTFAAAPGAASPPAGAPALERLEAAKTDTPATAPAPASQPAAVNDAYPGLASSGLTFARLADLPKGAVLKAGALGLSEKDVADQIAKAPQEVQEQLKKNAFFILEQMATGKLVLAEAKADAGKTATAPAVADERALSQAYLGRLAEKVTVSDDEIADFYKNNKDAVGGATLDQVKPQIAQYLRQQKQQELVAQHVRALGQRIVIEVSASWTQEQAALAKDNPVDKARASGKPSLVDFGSKGCRPCDMLAPILETLKKKYEGQANVLFVSVTQEQILAGRYGIESIPVQVFFDKDGKEVSRHVGFYPQEEIEKQMATLGVK